MGDSGLFALLRGGIKFQRDKHGKEMDLLGRQQGKAQRAADQTVAAAAETMPRELDFFGEHARREEAASRAKGVMGVGRTATRTKGAAESSSSSSSSASSSGGDDDDDDKSSGDNSDDDGDVDDGEDKAVEAKLRGRSMVEVSGEDEGARVRRVRKAHRIVLVGSDADAAALAPMEFFDALGPRFGARNYVVKNVMQGGPDEPFGFGYVRPTDVQMQAVPALCAGRELLCCAPTGSGKTLAYLLPLLLVHLPDAGKGGKGGKGGRTGPAAVVVAPTRELAVQIHTVFKRLVLGKKVKSCLLTKASAAGSDLAKVDVVIATPLRLLQTLQEGKCDLSSVRYLVLDEADKLFELGFVDQVDEILAAVAGNQDVVRCLFSATLSEDVEDLARSVLVDPLRLTVGGRGAANRDVEQQLIFCGSESGKVMQLRHSARAGKLALPAIVFVQSVDRAKELFSELVYDGLSVDVIHSERTQAQRNATVERFRQGKAWVLIATDVLARGLDFYDVATVINFDFPQTASSYIHRVGRTGRAGQRGLALTYFTEEDRPMLPTIANVVKSSGSEVPEWMLNLKRHSRSARKKFANRPIDRDTVSTVSDYDRKRDRKMREMVAASKRRSAQKDGGGNRAGTRKAPQGAGGGDPAPRPKSAKKARKD